MFRSTSTMNGSQISQRKHSAQYRSSQEGRKAMAQQLFQRTNTQDTSNHAVLAVQDSRAGAGVDGTTCFRRCCSRCWQCIPDWVVKVALLHVSSTCKVLLVPANLYLNFNGDSGVGWKTLYALAQVSFAISWWWKRDSEHNLYDIISLYQAKKSGLEVGNGTAPTTAASLSLYQSLRFYGTLVISVLVLFFAVAQAYEWHTSDHPTPRSFWWAELVVASCIPLSLFIDQYVACWLFEQTGVLQLSGTVAASPTSRDTKNVWRKRCHVIASVSFFISTVVHYYWFVDEPLWFIYLAIGLAVIMQLETVLGSATTEELHAIYDRSILLPSRSGSNQEQDFGTKDDGTSGQDDGTTENDGTSGMEMTPVERIV